MKGIRLSALIIGILAFLCRFQSAEAADAQDARFIPASQVSLTDWMAKIPDNALITEINMPATHDSGTTHMNWGVSRPLASCQSWTIPEQLKNGIRVLDIRVAGLKKGKDTTQWWNMEITHDVWRCATGSSEFAANLRLYDVIKDCAAFLRSHKQETVVIRLSYEDNKKTAAESMSHLRAFARPENKYNPTFSDGVPLLYYLPGDNIPALAEVRGCIVLIDDGSKDKMLDKKDGADSTYEMEYNRDSKSLRTDVIVAAATLRPFSFAAAKARYLRDVVNTKEGLLKRCFSAANLVAQAYTVGHGKTPGIWNRDGYYNEAGRYGEPGLKVIGTNLNTGGRLGPLSPSISDYSSIINSWLGKYNFQNGKRYGWVSMDHPVGAVIRKIIATNEVKSETVTIEVEWQPSYSFSVSAFGSRAFSVGALDYTQSWSLEKDKHYAVLRLTPEAAKQLEDGSISLDISASSPLLSRSEPVTYRMEHTGLNQWKCIVYEEIAVTLHWDLATAATAERLSDGFFTYRYANGQETVVPASLVRFGKTAGSTTVVYLQLLPEKSASDPIVLSINQAGLEYRYNADRDCEKKDLRHWAFTLHINAEAADYTGTLIFDDNDNRYGFRPGKGDSLWKIGCSLVATAAASGEDTDKERIIFTVPLSVNSENYTWSRNDLPLQDEEGTDLVWNLSISAPLGYTVSYQAGKTQLDATLTILPFTDVEIRWEGEDGDISSRPEAISLSLWEKSTGKYMGTKTANAQSGWRVHFDSGLLKDDWVLKISGRSALYEQTGPFITEDGKGAYFVFTRTNTVKISTPVYWQDGMVLQDKHPRVTVTLDNGRETVETATAGNTKYSGERILWNDGDTLPARDSEGKPYTYTVTAELEAAQRDTYSVFVQGYAVYLVRKATLTGQLYWNAPKRPEWITEPPALTLYRRKAGSGEAYVAVDGEPEWNWAAGSFTYSNLPLGIAGGEGTDRYEYRVKADAETMPGVAYVSTSMSYQNKNDSGIYTAELVATLGNVTAAIPFTITVTDNGFHPEQAFTVTLKDAQGMERAVQACTVGKNNSGGSYQIAATLPLAGTGAYTLTMDSANGSGWAVDTALKTVTLTARLNEETGEVELVPEGDAPAFVVTYTHTPEPVTAELTFRISIRNESELPEPPEEVFRLQPCLNGEKGEVKTVTGAGDLTLSYTFQKAGSYEISAEQLPLNSYLWEIDEQTRSLFVDIALNAEGKLTADYPLGRESTFENTYLGDTVHVTGSILWDEADFVYGSSLRPQAVMLSLIPFDAGEDAASSLQTEEPLATLPLTVTEESLQSFDFGWQKRFDDSGNLLNYTVREQQVPFYDSTENYYGYSVLNTLGVELIHASGTVTWTDADETYRPEQVTVRLFRLNAEGETEELAALTVTPDEEGDWRYDFGFYPAEDTGGSGIVYTVEEDAVGGYTAKIDGFMIENIKVNYKITEGDGQQYSIGSKAGALFVCDGPYNRFTCLTVDDTEVDRSNYTAVSGSTRLTLKSSWLDTLNKGTHTLRFHYTDGVSVTATFYVGSVPPTGDGAAPGLYACLLLLSAAAIVALLAKRAGLRKC